MSHEYDIETIRPEAGIARVRRRDSQATQWIEWPPSKGERPGAPAEDAPAVIHLAACDPFSDAPDTNSSRRAQRCSLRLAREDFRDPERTDFIVIPSSDGHAAENVVVFLHGQGDSHEPFARLGAAWALPQTAVIALRAPLELPLSLGHAWYEDFDAEFNVIPPNEVNPRRSASLRQARDFLWGFLDTLHAVHAWPWDRIFVVGYSQGANVAFHTTMTIPTQLGGIILIAGGAIAGTHNVDSTSATPEIPALILTGDKDAMYPKALVTVTINQYQARFGRSQIQHYETRGKSHGMISSRQEMLTVMRFFADHLYLRDRALEQQNDVYEVHLQ